jgi:hypothetical protein
MTSLCLTGQKRGARQPKRPQKGSLMGVGILHLSDAIQHLQTFKRFAANSPICNTILLFVEIISGEISETV